MKILFDSTLESISTRADGSVSVKLSTQEIDSSAAANLFGLRGKFIKCLLSDTNVSTVEAELIDNASVVGTKKKSPSARLRAVLYRTWEQENSTLEFEQWYASKMEDLITHFKSKLD